MNERTLGVLLMMCALPASALAQDADPPAPPAPPALPAPTLPDEPEPVAPAEPTAEPPRQILVRVGGRPSERLPGEDDEEDEPAALEDDIAFVVPGDLRTRMGEQGRLQLPGQTPPPPPLFSIAAGAGWSRMLAVEALDYVRLEQRFEARIDVAPEFRLGAGVAELIGPNVLVEVGPRAGFGASFCNEPELSCDAVILVQPGLIAGENRADFSLHAQLDLRLLVARIFMPSISGGISFFSGVTMVSLAGHVGLAF